MNNNEQTRLLVQAILRSPHELQWSVQGLGMLRTYLSQELRLHIWDDAFRIPGVSPIHDHPWHLDSYIVAGVYKQQRYMICLDETPTEYFKMATIKCGEGAFKTEDVRTVPVFLDGPVEAYRAGDSYHQRKDETHESFPENGTITLVTRTFTPDREHARVFWRGDGDWVDAAPRTATRDEINLATHRALNLWF